MTNHYLKLVWAFAVCCVAASAAAAAGAGLARSAEGLAPIPLAVLAAAVFGISYLGLTLALKHPDAASLWKFIR